MTSTNWVLADTGLHGQLHHAAAQSTTISVDPLNPPPNPSRSAQFSPPAQDEFPEYHYVDFDPPIVLDTVESLGTGEQGHVAYCGFMKRWIAGVGSY